MCRVVAVHAARPVPLYRLLIGGDNSFAVQSLEHPDGWGLAYYQDGDPVPAMVKSVLPAICDELFEQASFSISSSTVLAHIRRASVGPVRQPNCHPFRRGRWVFAHNGEIQDMGRVRDALLERVDPDLRAVDGETDSEIYLLLFLTALRTRVSLDAPAPDAATLADALGDTIRTIRGIADGGPGLPLSSLTCVASNGSVMLGLNGGKPLSVRQLESWGGRSASAQDRAVMFSSEEISTKGLLAEDSAWQELGEGELAVVGADLALVRHLLR